MKTNYIFKNACLLACFALGFSSFHVNAAPVKVGEIVYEIIDFNGTPAVEVVPLTPHSYNDEGGFNNVNAPLYEGNITIPAEVVIDGTTYPVKRIGDHAMRDTPNLTGVTFSEGLEVIGNSAYARATALTALQLPASVNSIEEYAFFQTTSLTTINIPEGIKVITGHCFQESGVTAIELPSSVTELEVCAFQTARNLASINLENIRKMSSWLFTSTALTEVRISDVPVIGAWSFGECPNLKTVELKNVASILDNCFTDCPELETVIMTEIESVGKWCFQDCHKMTTAKMGDALEVLQQGAFSTCKSLTSIKLSNTVTSLSDWSLEKTGIKEIYMSWSEEELEYLYIDENAFGAGEGKIEFRWKVPETLRGVYGSVFEGYPIDYYEVTSIDNTIAESISAFYANGSLNLNNLNGYNATIVSLDGSTVAGFQVNGEAVEVPVTLNKGIYLLNATNGSDRTAVKFIVR